MKNASFLSKPFAQRVRNFFTTDNGLASDNILSAGIDSSGKFFAGCDKGLFAFDGSTFKPVSGFKSAVQLIANVCDILFVAEGKKLTGFKNGKNCFSREFESDIVAVDADGKSKIWLLTVENIFTFDGSDFVLYKNVEDRPATGLVCYGDGIVFITNPASLIALHGKRPHWSGIMMYNSDIPSDNIQAVAADSWGHIWLGTEKGLCIYDSKNCWLTVDKIEALPSENIRKIVLGSDGTRYLGTDIGLIIQGGVEQHFLGAERWLPDGEVTAIAVSDDGNTVWVGTKKGLSRITTKMMTLGEKAAIYQDVCEKYHVREGYVITRFLNTPGKIEDGYVENSDNDGLWTGNYCATQSLRYGATKDEEALLLARRSMRAMLKLMIITGKKGFTARSYRRPGEDRFGNGDKEWHLVEDENGPLEWKCETSSDEMVGHFYGLSLYYDICADEAEKAEISDALCAIVDHILENDYTLCDIDGLPTTWACWGPEELNNDDKWFWEHGINSLEMLTMLKVAFYMSGKKKYDKEYVKLITKHHYALNCVQHKINDAHVSHIDDNLGFLTIVILLRLEDDPQLRQYYLLGLRHHWENQFIERCPLWNIIYCALTGEIKGLDAAIQSLRELPLDLIQWTTTNSLRSDLEWDEGQEFYGGGRQLKEPLPYDEKPITKYDGNPFRADCNCNNSRVTDGAIFLHPYWFARYYGLID